MIDWHQAHSHIAAMSLDSGGWRMPTNTELHALYDGIRDTTGCFDCTGDQGPFDDIPLGNWTTLTYGCGHPGAFYVGF